MIARRLVTITSATACLAVASGCGDRESSTDRANRASTAIESCRAHGGVSAFDDDAVICADQTGTEARGASAVEECKDHGGVSAFDDDIVICDDQTFHRAEGG